MNSKPKVLFLAPFPPPMGGIANQSQLLFDSPQFNEQFSVYCIKTNPYRKSEEPGKRGRWLSLWSIRFLFQVISRSFSVKPDLVFLRENGDISLIRNGIAAIVASRISGSPLLMYIHITKSGSWIRKSRFNKIGDWILSKIVRQADVLIHLSEAANNEFISRGWKCADHIIPNAVDCINHPNQVNKSPSHFCFIGRLSREKGFLDILTALKATDLKEMKWTFHAMGAPRTNIDKRLLDNLLEKHPCRDKIILHGPTYGINKWRILQNCSFMLFPSHKENFPNVILEGMAAEQAIIATRVGEIPIILKDSAWIPVDVGDIKGIAYSIRSLIRDEQHTIRMGKVNREQAEQYRLSTLCSTICSIIDSLCKK